MQGIIIDHDRRPTFRERVRAYAAAVRAEYLRAEIDITARRIARLYAENAVLERRLRAALRGGE